MQETKVCGSMFYAPDHGFIAEVREVFDTRGPVLRALWPLLDTVTRLVCGHSRHIPSRLGPPRLVSARDPELGAPVRDWPELELRDPQRGGQ